MERIFTELHDAYANSASGQKSYMVCLTSIKTQGESLIVNSPCGKF